jgi:hypothetical protein
VLGGTTITLQDLTEAGIAAALDENNIGDTTVIYVSGFYTI